MKTIKTKSGPLSRAEAQARMRPMKHKSVLDAQRHLTYCYYENLEAIVGDLKALEKLIPRESCRHGLFLKDEEDRAIAEARKNELLGYIQTICLDHIRWSERLLERGCTAKGREVLK